MFDVKWTAKELAKIREIQARPPEKRSQRHPLRLESYHLSDLDGLSNAEVIAYLKRCKL